MKKIVIFSVIFFIVAATVGWYIIFERPITPSGPVDDAGGLVQPFGGSSSDRSITSQATTTPIQTNVVALANLTHIFSDPVSGATIISSKTGSSTNVRFAERATGHIYDVSLITGETNKVSITTIPKIYNSMWLPSGSSTIFQYLDPSGSLVETYLANLISNTGSSTDSSVAAQTQGTFLPSNISSIAINPSGTKIFYMVRSQSGSVGITANTDGSKKTQIFSSAISEWTAQWPSEGTITLTTKAAAGINGYTYFMDTAGGIRKILGNIDGLTTLTNPQATLIAASNSSLSLQIYDAKTGSSKSTFVQTLPEKCTWSPTLKNILYCAVPISVPAGSYPDSWYQGLVSFSDNIYKIDATTGAATNIGSLKDTYSQDIDAINLSVSKDGNYLVFMNKKDLSLWTYRISQ